MFCNKCGNQLSTNQKFCNKCGNVVHIENTTPIYQKYNSANKFNEVKKAILTLLKKLNRTYVIGGFVLLSFIILVTVFLCSFKKEVYFSEGSSTTGESNVGNNNAVASTSKSRTTIVYDKVYENMKISSKQDANNLIIKDSNDQKEKCTNNQITDVENRIIKNYGITAVNLCELNLDYAKEIENVIKKIYNDYPKIRGYLTNLTLTNTSMSNNYIAVFIGTMPFASSNTSSTYPWIFKTVIGMNSTYFLNPNRIESSVSAASASGFFPKNATRYSPVAHEFGHYISFLTTLAAKNMKSILMINESNYSNYYNLVSDWSKGINSKKIIEEAHKNYLTKYNDGITELAFRQSISQYAITKDNDGNYIYDETISESFHDYYLNGNNASKASLEIVAVLKTHLDRLGD